MTLSHTLWNRTFSHVYIEEKIVNHPNTERILSHTKAEHLITIDNYAQLFNRNRQNFHLQKKAQNLILAEKHFDFYYDGSPFCENFGCTRFYYTTMVMNCLYDCSYCYLKSIYPCGHMVIFVNNTDFIHSVEKDLLDGRPLYLAISYDSDLMALESLTGFIHEWFQLAQDHPELTIEIKTKCPVFPFDGSIPSNIIFAWSLLPQTVISRYEPRTPSLEQRIHAVNKALSKGASFRLSLEPIMPVPEFQTVYTAFAKQLANMVPLNELVNINIGGFRISGKQFKNFCRKDPYSPVLAYSFVRKGNSIVYENEEIYQSVLYENLVPFISDDKLILYLDKTESNRYDV